ncbi:MAG: flavodoxin family protein [Erysipelotrichaceae bacterium]|nr:flavodoxin family protein [Erysipelotrichaceae bacterium]
MNLLIHDYTTEEWNNVKTQYEGWDVVFDNGSIHPCIGCFYCWTSGNGKCIQSDGYENMGERIHNAEEVVISSQYTYGGFSVFVKNVFDRCIGYVLPEFEVAYGEMHHKKRYDEDKPVTFIFRGHNLSDEEKQQAKEYVRALCRNLRGHVKDVLFIEEKETEPAAKQPSVKRSGTLLVNCSLRKERSNTGLLLKELQKDLGTAALTELSFHTDFQKLAEQIRHAETVVLGMPLYVDGLPSSAIRLLDAIKGSVDGCNIYLLVNNGLYESKQNINLIRMVHSFCKQANANYMGTLAVGAGEVVGTLMRQKHPLWPAKNATDSVQKLAFAIQKKESFKETFADTKAFPRWLYILIANTNWQKLKAQKKNSR